MSNGKIRLPADSDMLRILALTCVAMLAFAANSVLCRLALAQLAIDPASFTLLRILSGAIVLGLIFSFSRTATARIGGSWSGAIALFIYAGAFSYAYITLSAGTGALILFGAVQVTMIGYGFMRGERLTALQSMGVALALVGLVILISPGAAAPSMTGAALMLAAGVAWGAYSLLGRGVADPLSSTAGNFIRALPIAILLSISTAVVGVNLTAEGIVYAVLSGAVASGLGYTIWYAALPGLTSAQGASVQLSVPVVTALGGALMLGEAISLRLALCSLAILGGIALVIRYQKRPSKNSTIDAVTETNGRDQFDCDAAARLHKAEHSRLSPRSSVIERETMMNAPAQKIESKKAQETEARIRKSLSSPISSDNVIDPQAILAGLLKAVGLEPDASGGAINFIGKDPILKSPWPLATMGGVSLMGKAVGAAALWRYRTGEGQDLTLDLRRVPRRLCPFYDKKWELINGYSPGLPHDPTNPFWPNFIYPTKDARWIQLYNIYPMHKTSALAFLGCADNPKAITEVTRKWNSFELEEAANMRGVQATVIRTAEEFLELEQFKYLAEQPLIEIEKIGDTDPIPFKPRPTSPLDGIRALGLGHVIAGPGVGRAMAFHGADVLNIWRPMDFETDGAYHTSSVGLRSSTIEFANPEGREKMLHLVKDADVFFANRRPGYLNQFRLTAEELAEIRPGLVHLEMSLYGPTGPWNGRTGYDQNAGGVSGLFTREGTFENPKLTEIFVVNDYAMAWLSFLAITAALRRRAIEGGSYRIRISLVRLSIWLLEMGMFDKTYAHQIGHSAGDHEFLPPELFTADTPLGHYQGVTDQVLMSKTPGNYKFVLVPRGSSKPEWLAS